MKEEIQKIKSLLHDAALRKYGTAKRLEELKSDKGPKRREGRPPNQMHGGQNKGGWDNKKHQPNNNMGNNQGNWLQPEDPLAKEIRNKAKQNQADTQKPKNNN